MTAGRVYSAAPPREGVEPDPGGHGAHRRPAGAARRAVADADPGTYGQSTRTGARRVLGGLGLGVLLLVLGLLVKTGPLTAVGVGADTAVSGLRNGLFTAGAKLVTLLATPELWAVLGLVIPVVLVVARRRGQALRVFGVLIGTTAVTYVAKFLVQEHRPPHRLWLETPSSESFPSGHTAAACAVAVMLIILARPTAKRRMTIVGGVVVGLVAASRVYLGVHYPMDTLGGALACATATVVLSGLAHLPPLRRFLLVLDDASRGAPASRRRHRSA
jgi:undecaprenyl-diphosphatase